MNDDLIKTNDYKDWLINLKTRLRTVQLKAAVSVNSALLQFYWDLGADIVAKQKQAEWGTGFLKQLSVDLRAEFPEIKGFSERNIKFIRQWHLFYQEGLIKGKQPVSLLGKEEASLVVKQPVSLLGNTEGLRQVDSKLIQGITQIPWGHNISIIQKCKNYQEAVFYVRKTQEHNWSRNVLTHQIESNLWNREGKAISNFSEALPAQQSDLAQQILKDPYVFDFMSLSPEYNERELELKLVDHISSFLLELGAGFAYMGRQYALEVGERDFFLDLLFYHTKLHCYIVIELKTGDFEPEYAGKLNFYLKAVDEQIKSPNDQPSIGILLCKNRDKLVAEYALSDIHKPMGISEYNLTQSLPDNLKSALPSIEEIEAELSEEKL